MKFERFRNLSKRKKIILIVATLIAVVLILAFALGAFRDDEPQQTAQPQKYYSKLTGKEVSKEVSEQPILGVMIENSRAARPQTGLDSAGIVFEAVTEGGITRYLALYQEDPPEIVGPVRSLRTHFLNWLMGFDASVAHVGGSKEALDLAKQRDAKSLSQMRFSQPYYRDNSRVSPHNMYARFNELTKLQNEEDHKSSQFPDIPWREATPASNTVSTDSSEANTATKAEQKASKIMIDFSSSLFVAEFRYDSSSNSYTRYLAGAPHIDKSSGKPITVKNLIVIKARGLSAGLNVLGSGEALIFNDGKVQKGRWQQTDFKNRIKLLDETNNEIALLRGDSWFAAVASGRPIKY